MEKKRYWTYLIDDYQRDLPGFAWWILESGFNNDDKVCLLPTKELTDQYLLKERPDVIVWNYARNNNIKRIKTAKYLNIYNIIHDTEGIPYKMELYFNIKEKYLNYIDEIWCWGSQQKEIINQKIKNIKYKPKLRVLGSLRYEYAKTLKKCNIKYKIGEVLWNTNFPSIDPKYQNIFREYKEYYKLHKFCSEEKAFELFIEIAMRRQSAFEYIKSLFENIEPLKLIIRPHPFESSRFYKKNKFGKTGEIVISEDNDIHNDLDMASLVIQNGCQTVIESFIRGVPSIRTTKEIINIWSKVSPYIEKKQLEAEIKNINFLNAIYEEQTKLFKQQKIDQLLENLFKKIGGFKKIDFKNSKNRFKIEGMISILILKIKMMIKYYAKANNSALRDKKNKLSSVMIKNYLDVHYNQKNYYYNGLCFALPINKLSNH